MDLHPSLNRNRWTHILYKSVSPFNFHVKWGGSVLSSFFIVPSLIFMLFFAQHCCFHNTGYLYLARRRNVLPENINR